MRRTYSVCPWCLCDHSHQAGFSVGGSGANPSVACSRKEECDHRLFKQAWAPLGSPITHMCCEVLSQQEADSTACPADGPRNNKGTHTYNDIQLKTQEQTFMFTGNWLSAKCSRDWMGKVRTPSRDAQTARNLQLTNHAVCHALKQIQATPCLNVRAKITSVPDSGLVRILG